MERCVIVAGAAIGEYERIRRNLHPDDFFLFCDGGLYHQERLGVTPRLIVGDFDSHPVPTLPVETIILPREKDDTDTVYAVKEALRRGYEDFLLIGVVGGRLDHTLGNVSILLDLYRRGKRAKILDDCGEMEIVGQEGAVIPPTWTYFSLLNIAGMTKGVTIRHARYPLTEAEIPCTYPYGISNQPLPGETATVTVGQGEALLIRIARDAGLSGASVLSSESSSGGTSALSPGSPSGGGDM